jgi:glycosyltransferase involved in cell wall biosynthesis
MDGGSTDNSIEIIKKHEKYLTYWQSQADNGQYPAINEGFRKTTGEIMAWLNSDDKYHPNALFKVAYVFSKSDAISWITGRPSYWDQHGHINSIEPVQPLWSRDMFLKKTIRKPIQQESTFWRRSLWEQTGSGLDVRFTLAADLDLWLRFFRYDQLYSVNTLLGGYRIHGNQKTRLFMENYIKEGIERLDGETFWYTTSEDKTLLSAPPIMEISGEFNHYSNIRKPKTILQSNCWRYYRHDLEAFKRTAESQGLLAFSHLLNAELLFLK